MDQAPSSPALPDGPAGPEHPSRPDRVAVPTSGPTVRALEGRVVGADWGAPDLLAPYLPGATGGSMDASEAASTGSRAAEVWYGAHPRNPSWVVDGAGRRPATEIDPRDRPDLLVKLLAAGGPLSIQVHPDDAAARRGFAADEAAGIPLDAPERRFVDTSGKPELVRAVGPMRVLCGLRSAAASRRLLSILAPTGIDGLLEALGHGDAALGEIIGGLLRARPVERGVLLASVADGAHDVLARVARTAALASERDTALEEEQSGDAAAVVRMARLALDLQARFPDDAGTLVALLLEDADLAPGETLFVAPGTPHAYLSGLGVEVMASSDNVLRGGMTVKHVDVDGFLALLDTHATGVPRVGRFPRGLEPGGWQRTIIPSDAFVVDEARIEGTLRVERSGNGAGILLCVDGELEVRAGDGSVVRLRPGAAAIMSAGFDGVDVQGDGTVVHASTGRRALQPVG